MISDFSVKYGWDNTILLTKEVMKTTVQSSEIYENFKLNNQEKASKNLLKEMKCGMSCDSPSNWCNLVISLQQM